MGKIHFFDQTHHEEETFEHDDIEGEFNFSSSSTMCQFIKNIFSNPEENLDMYSRQYLLKVFKVMIQVSPSKQAPRMANYIRDIMLQSSPDTWESLFPTIRKRKKRAPLSSQKKKKARI